MPRASLTIIWTSAAVDLAPPVKVQVSGTMVVISLPMMDEKSPETIAVLVNGDAAFGSTMTVTVIGGYDWPPAMELDVLQICSCRIQLHTRLSPVMETIDSPEGGV